MTAYREGLFSDEELLAAAGDDFEALVEKSPETAIRVADALSGVRIYVPKRLTEDCRINEFVNEADAQIVISVYPTELICVPRFMPLRRKIRNRRIAGLHAAGWMPSELAMHFQLTERQIFAILHRCRQEPPVRSSTMANPTDRNEPTRPVVGR